MTAPPQVTTNALKSLPDIPSYGNPPVPGNPLQIQWKKPMPIRQHSNPYPKGQEPTLAEQAAMKRQEQMGDVRPRSTEPGIDRLRHFMEYIPSTTPNEHILFGAGPVKLTVGDMRLITGII